MPETLLGVFRLVTIGRPLWEPAANVCFSPTFGHTRGVVEAPCPRLAVVKRAEGGCPPWAHLQRSRGETRPIRYGPTRRSSWLPFQLSLTKPSAKSSSTAAWTFGISFRHPELVAPVAARVAIARATSLGQTVAPGGRAARSANVALRASEVGIAHFTSTFKASLVRLAGAAIGFQRLHARLRHRVRAVAI